MVKTNFIYLKKMLCCVRSLGLFSCVLKLIVVPVSHFEDGCVITQFLEKKKK